MSTLIFIHLVLLAAANASDDQSAKSTFKPTLSTNGTALCASETPATEYNLTGSSTLFPAAPACMKLRLQCAWLCTQDKNCTGYNIRHNESKCQLFYNCSLTPLSVEADCEHFQSQDLLSRRNNSGCPLPATCEPRNLTVAVHDGMRLYIDGEMIKDLPNATTRQNCTVQLPCDARVIAIEGMNRCDNVGILASTDDGFIITNKSWKCTVGADPITFAATTGWQNVGYSDFSWHQAKEVEKQPASGINGGAQWIWTDKELTAVNRRVYCRLRIG